MFVLVFKQAAGERDADLVNPTDLPIDVVDIAVECCAGLLRI